MKGMELPSTARAIEHDFHDGLAYRTWLPESDPPWPGIVVLHGAGSCKENHADFARLAADFGWAVLAYDQRGHGESLGEMSPTAVDDAVAMARKLAAHEGVDPARVCVRGSSMGGFVAIHAAAVSDAIAGAIAICPPSERMLAEGLRSDPLEMRADALVSVRCGNVTLTEGRMGRVGDRVAIRVTKQLRKPNTTLAMFEKADEQTKLMEAQ